MWVVLCTVTSNLDTADPELNPKCPDVIRGHISCGRVCFPTEEELQREKHFLIHGVKTFPVGQKRVYKSGVKIAGYYINEHTDTQKGS